MNLSLVLMLVAASDTQVIEAEGAAPLSLGYTQAVQRAKDAALRNVILKACKELEAKDASIAQCTVTDERLFAGFAGAVSKLDVLSQKVTQDTVQVKVRAELSLRESSTAEAETQRLYQRLNGPKLSVAIDELVQKKDGAEPTPTVQILAAKLSEQFVADGWKLYPYTPEAPQAAFALVGKVVTQASQDRMTGEIQVHDLAAKKSIGAVSVDFRGTEPAGIAKNAPALFGQLRDVILKALRESETRGIEVAVKISDFKKEADIDEVIAHLQRVTGVLSIELRAHDETSVELLVRSTAPAKDLARTISKAMGARVAVTGVRGNAIDATAK